MDESGTHRPFGSRDRGHAVAAVSLAGPNGGAPTGSTLSSLLLLLLLR